MGQQWATTTYMDNNNIHPPLAGTATSDSNTVQGQHQLTATMGHNKGQQEDRHKGYQQGTARKRHHYNKGHWQQLGTPTRENNNISTRNSYNVNWNHQLKPTRDTDNKGHWQQGTLTTRDTNNKGHWQQGTLTTRDTDNNFGRQQGERQYINKRQQQRAARKDSDTIMGQHQWAITIDMDNNDRQYQGIATRDIDNN